MSSSDSGIINTILGELQNFFSTKNIDKLVYWIQSFFPKLYSKNFTKDYSEYGERQKMKKYNIEIEKISKADKERLDKIVNEEMEGIIFSPRRFKGKEVIREEIIPYGYLFGDEREAAAEADMYYMERQNIPRQDPNYVGSSSSHSGFKNTMSGAEAAAAAEAELEIRRKNMPKNEKYRSQGIRINESSSASSEISNIIGDGRGVVSTRQTPTEAEINYDELLESLNELEETGATKPKSSYTDINKMFSTDTREFEKMMREAPRIKLPSFSLPSPHTSSSHISKNINPFGKKQ